MDSNYLDIQFRNKIIDFGSLCAPFTRLLGRYVKGYDSLDGNVKYREIKSRLSYLAMSCSGFAVKGACIPPVRIQSVYSQYIFKDR